MQSIATLGIEIKSTGVDEATRKLKGLEQQGAATERRASELSERWAKAGRVIGAAVGTGIGLATTAFGLYIRNTIEAEKVQAQLAARIKSTGGAAGLAIGELNRMAGALQDATTFDDESIGEAQALLLTFTKITRDNFGRATEAVLDMSTAMGTDLKSSALQVGKALNDPVLGVTALSRAGVQFTQSQKDVIKNLVDTGQVAKAQGIVLRELETQMGGAARAARNTLGGALQALKNSFDNLLEGDAGDEGIVGARNAIESFNRTLNDPAIKSGVQSLIGDMVKLASFAAQAAGAFGGLAQAVRDAFSADSQKSYLGLLSKRADLVDDLADATSGGENPLSPRRLRLIAGGRSGEAYSGVAGMQAKIAEIDRRLAALNYGNPGKNGPVVDNHSGTGIFANVNTTPPAPTGGTGGGGRVNSMRDYGSATRDATAAIREQQAAEEALLAKSLADEDSRSDAIKQFARLSAELSGPLKVAELDHIERMQQIADLGAKAGVGAAAITAAQAQETAAYEQTTAAIKAQQDALANPETVQIMDDLRRGWADNLTDVALNTKSAGAAVKDMLNDMAAEITHFIGQRWGEKLFGSFGTTGSGSSGGNWLGGLLSAIFGGGGGGHAAFQGALAAGAFKEGGYTGDGPRDGVAGVVHYGEVVIPAGMVENIRRGNHDGGMSLRRAQSATVNQTIIVQGLMRDNTPMQLAQASAREQARARRNN